MKNIELGELSLSGVLNILRDHTDYDPQQQPEDDFRKLFGDPRHTPSYEYFRKLVKIGEHETLTNRANWNYLPDSFEAIYQLSFFHADCLTEQIKTGQLLKSMTLQTIMSLFFEARKVQKQKTEAEHKEMWEKLNSGDEQWFMTDK